MNGPGEGRADAPRFEPHRFDALVERYVAHRLRYAPRLIGWIAREAALCVSSTVLDLGCGPGFLAEAFAPFAGRVLGVDPSPAMLAAARARAPANATYHEGSSHDLSAVPPGLALVVMGRSFHWMDRAATLATLDGLVAPDGTVSLVGAWPIEGPGMAWWRAAMAAADGFAEEGEHDRLRRAPDRETHEEVLLRSPFADLCRISVFARHRWTLAELAGFVLSRSTTGAADPAGLVAALAEALAAHGPGPWTSVHEHRALLARRPR